MHSKVSKQERENVYVVQMFTGHSSTLRIQKRVFHKKTTSKSMYCRQCQQSALIAFTKVVL